MVVARESITSWKTEMSFSPKFHQINRVLITAISLSTIARESNYNLQPPHLITPVSSKYIKRYLQIKKLEKVPYG